MLGLQRGRVYYNLLNWYRLLEMVPGFRVNRRFMEQMMGVREPLAATSPAATRGPWHRLRRCAATSSHALAARLAHRDAPYAHAALPGTSGRYARSRETGPVRIARRRARGVLPQPGRTSSRALGRAARQRLRHDAVPRIAAAHGGEVGRRRTAGSSTTCSAKKAASRARSLHGGCARWRRPSPTTGRSSTFFAMGRCRA